MATEGDAATTDAQAPQEPEGANKRTKRRVDMRVPVEFSGRHVRGRGFLCNISESGALVEDADPLVVAGGRVRLRFAFFQDSLPVEIPATVVRETPTGFAVQFAGLDARLKSVLALVIARIRAAENAR
jgi:hypothetical protein